MSNMRRILLLFVMLIGICVTDVYSQQDPQFTQYMYNTMSVNPGYAGSRGHTTITALGRTQWVGFEGAPDSQTLSYDTPLNYKGLGFGVNLVNDKLGPSQELYLDANVSYTIETSEDGNLAFGLKLGGRMLNVDWSKGKDAYSSEGKGIDPMFAYNIKNRFLPTVGAGIYFYKPKWYVGLSVPNFLRSEHYDVNSKDIQTAINNINDPKFKKDAIRLAEERIHFFLIAGYVFDLTEDIKFKPAALLKGVAGAPLIADVSANFLFNERFRAGLAWRWDDSVSALLGVQLSRSLYAGYAYDLTTSNYRVTNSGTHEIMLRYEVLGEIAIKSPRFF